MGFGWRGIVKTRKVAVRQMKRATGSVTSPSHSYLLRNLKDRRDNRCIVRTGYQTAVPGHAFNA